MIVPIVNKYAKADKVKVSIREEHNFCLFDLSDNGIGFDAKRNGKGIGLKNIKSRIEDLKGAIELSSSPGLGTQIKMIIPLFN